MAGPDGDGIPLAALGGARQARATIAGIASIVGPGTLVTALLYYFGWARNSAQASALGLQDSLLGFATQDYLLSSISPMFWPMVVTLVTVLAGLLLHGAVVSWADRPDASGSRLAGRRQAIKWMCAAGVGLGVASILFGAWGFDKTTRFFALASPLGITVGIISLGYALHLYRRFVRVRHGPDTPELRAVRLLSTSIFTVLLLLSVFWSVSHYAAVTGIDLAVRLEQGLQRQPSVTVYSASRLHLQPPVAETVLPGDPSAYHFRYTGLKLLFRSEHRYFLRPADASVSGVNIVLAEGPDIRFEFSFDDPVP